MSKTYRLVADYGWGDKTWLERNLSEKEAIQEYNEKTGRGIKNIEEAESDYHPFFFVEEDRPDDVEDWDWWDS